MDLPVINTLFTGAALLTLLTYLGYQLRTVPGFILRNVKKHIIYSVYIEESSSLFLYLEQWLEQNHKNAFKNVTVTLSTSNQIELHHYVDSFILTHKKKKLLITKGREKFENASDPKSAFYNKFIIQGIKAKHSILDLIQETIKLAELKKADNQDVYMSGKYANWDFLKKLPHKTFDSLFFKQKESLIQDLLKFNESAEWYKTKGLDYRRGYLLSGPPGNGKSSICLAVARLLKKDIYFLNLNDISYDGDLLNLIKRIPSNAILVLEDVDCIIRNPTEGKTKVSFSTILNCLDGILTQHGLITILTTNHPEKLDPALIRTGRIDMKLTLENPSKEQVEAYISYFFKASLTLNSYTSNYSMSDIQELCVSHQNNPLKLITIIKRESYES